MIVRTLPSINTGNEVGLQNIDLTNRIIIQEKVDGSQFTVYKDRNNQLHYYNKNKERDGKGKPFLNAFLSIQGKEDMFEVGYFYHGEAMTSRLTNTNEYERVPNCFWIIYEIVREDNTVLSPEEMEIALKDTPFETVKIFYDNKHEEPTDLTVVVDKIMKDIENKRLVSGLGGIPEGCVVKVINVLKKDKYSTTRYKYVREEFQEANHTKKKRLPQVSDQDFIQELGSIYNTDARFQKAIQHLQERNCWKDNIEKNIPGLVDELDRDLIKEELDEIKNLLFIRFWPEISKASRAGLQDFLKK